MNNLIKEWKLTEVIFSIMQKSRWATEGVWERLISERETDQEEKLISLTSTNPIIPHHTEKISTSGIVFARKF